MEPRGRRRIGRGSLRGLPRLPLSLHPSCASARAGLRCTPTRRLARLSSGMEETPLFEHTWPLRDRIGHCLNYLIVAAVLAVAYSCAADWTAWVDLLSG